MSVNLKRRKIISTGAATILLGSTASLFLNSHEDKKLNNVKSVKPGQPLPQITNKIVEQDLAVQDNLNKVKHFNKIFSDDIFLSKENHKTFKQLLSKILRVKKIVGYANFNLLSFDDMLLYSHRYPKIGKFTRAELALIDELFFYDANKYGFHGDKVVKELTAKINKKETVKIAGSGHYLFQGDALDKYKQLKKDVGPELILTSGVRSVVKQFQLFLAKLDASNGNLSLASRSLAPPGHSYHGIGDFDVGKKGFGKLNFTSEFSHTDEYQKLIELKYVDLRYTKQNQVGVRYEPWHIKVV